MYFVYKLKSLFGSEIYYIGITKDLDRRILEHNNGQCDHTVDFLPWELIGYIAFKDKYKADKFERYLKTGSERAFAKRHF